MINDTLPIYKVYGCDIFKGEFFATWFFDKKDAEQFVQARQIIYEAGVMDDSPVYYIRKGTYSEIKRTVF